MIFEVLSNTNNGLVVSNQQRRDTTEIILSNERLINKLFNKLYHFKQ